MPNPIYIAPRSAMQEWEQLARQLGKTAEEIIKMQTQAEFIFTVNGLGEQIASTEAGQPVGDSGYNRESALAVQAMLESFKQWTQTPLEGAGGATPVQIIFRR
jgi:hypothetical protein